MDFIEGKDVVALARPGVVSRQLIWPQNAQTAFCTLTEVHVEPHGVQPRHAHETSEQIWYALAGTGLLLLADGRERAFVAGDVCRIAPGEAHGLAAGDQGFTYLSVTCPPIDFRGSYESAESGVGVPPRA